MKKIRMPTVIHGFLFCLWIAQPVYAESFLANIINGHEIKTANVVLITNDWSFGIPLDETTFKKIGCTYMTMDPRLVGGLTQVLEAAEIKETDNYVYLSPREGVYLTFNNGDDAELLLSPTTKAGIVMGHMTYFEKTVEEPLGTNEFLHTRKVRKFYVTAKGSLPAELFRWAANERLRVIAAHSHGMELSCEKETNRYPSLERSK